MYNYIEIIKEIDIKRIEIRNGYKFNEFRQGGAYAE